jgi:hypothetical protein
MQPDNFIYMPRWLKIIAVMTLGLLACGAVGLTLHYLYLEAEADWVVLSFSVAQAALSILILLLVGLFSRRNVDFSELSAKSDRFLQHEIPFALRQIETIKNSRTHYFKEAQVRLSVMHAPGTDAAWYKGTIDGIFIFIRIGLRGDFATVAFYLSLDEHQGEARIRSDFSRAIGVSSRNFEVSVRQEGQPFADGRTYHCMFLDKPLPAGFLFDTEQRFVFARQVAQIVRLVCFDAHQKDLTLLRVF